MANNWLANYCFIGLTLNGVICGFINQPDLAQKIATQVPLMSDDSSEVISNSNPPTSHLSAFVSAPSIVRDLPVRPLNLTLKTFTDPLPASIYIRDQEKRRDKPPTSSKSSGETEGYTRNDGTYVINDSDGIPCILAYFSSKITVYYAVSKDKQKVDSVRVSPPRDVNVTGSCNRKSLVAVLNLSWNEGVFCLKFGFDDITDSWYVGQFSFTYQTSNKRYKGAVEDETVILKSLPSRRYWATSHARSFRCLLLHDVTLVDDDDKHTGTIHFDEARVQALTRTANFKTPKHCIHRVHRNEMVPATVGGILVAVSVLTVAGYAVFRYFKVKKFQYDTME